jgi:hypothetical protein
VVVVGVACGGGMVRACVGRVGDAVVAPALGLVLCSWPPVRVCGHVVGRRRQS